jgi:hypothetical protein
MVAQDENSVAFLADGKHVVGLVREEMGMKVRRWRVEDGQYVGKPMDVAQDGKWIVCGAKSGQVIVWDVKPHARKGGRVQNTQHLGECGGRLGRWDENRDRRS